MVRHENREKGLITPATILLIILLLAAIGYSFYYVLTFLNKMEYSGTLSMELVLIIHRAIVDVTTSPDTSRLIILSIPPNCQIVFSKGDAEKNIPGEVRFEGLAIDQRLLYTYKAQFRRYDQARILEPTLIIGTNTLIVKYTRTGVDKPLTFNENVHLGPGTYTILLTSISFNIIRIEVSYGG